MAYKNEKYDVEFTEECIENIKDIYNYISVYLKENNIARSILKEVTNKVLNLAYNPELYVKIEKMDKLKRIYHKMIIKNYIILYTIDYKNKKVFVSRMIYGKRNYLN